MSNATLQQPTSKSTSAAAKPADTQLKKKYRFEVLGGAHWEPGEVEDPQTGRKTTKDIPYGPGRPAGPFIDSDIELDRLYNRKNAIKFKRLGEGDETWPEDLKRELLRANEAEARYKRALNNLDAKGLMSHADGEGIDTKGQSKKEDLIKTILDAVGISPSV